MRILGISAFYHDSAAALTRPSSISAAAQEERFTRRKHDAAFPHHAIAYCLAEAGVAADELDHVVFYDKPFLKFERLLETYIALAPRGFRSFKMSIPLWLREKLFQKSLLRDELEKFSEDFDKGRLLVEVLGKFPEFVAQQAFLKQFLPQPERDRHLERAEPARRQRDVGLQQPLEFEKRLVVEHDMVKLVGRNAGLRKAIGDGVVRKRGVVLAAGKTLLLRRGAVVIERRNTQDPHRASRTAYR